MLQAWLPKEIRREKHFRPFTWYSVRTAHDTLLNPGEISFKLRELSVFLISRLVLRHGTGGDGRNLCSVHVSSSGV